MNTTDVVNLSEAPVIDHPSAYEAVSPDIMTLILTQLATIYSFLCGTGLNLLEQKEPLSFNQWKVLFDHVFQVWNTGSNRYTQTLLEKTIERGIKDAGSLISPNPFSDIQDRDYFIRQYQRQKSDFTQWVIRYLSYNLCRERIPNDSNRSALIKLFMEQVVIPLMKKTEGECGQNLVHSIAVSRHPGDNEAQKRFENHWSQEWKK